jgi:hypothetical protein
MKNKKKKDLLQAILFYLFMPVFIVLFLFSLPIFLGMIPFMILGNKEDDKWQS